MGSMLSDASKALVFAIQEYGRSLLQDPKRLEAVLRDLAPCDRRGVTRLVTACTFGVPQELLGSNGPLSGGRAVRLLTEDADMEAGAAQWAVETWAAALGVPVDLGGETPAAARPGSAMLAERGEPLDIPPEQRKIVEKAIRKELDLSARQTIADAERERVEILDLSKSGLTAEGLKEVARLGNLTDLDLSNTQVVDLSPLARLGNLNILNLSETQVEDLSPLAGLDNLNILNLSNTQVVDLSPLAKLEYLTSLNLSDIRARDLSPLAGLVNLTTLNLKNTPVEDLSPLAGLTNLTELNLSMTQVEDLSPLAELTNLTELNLSITQVEDLSPLAGLVNLTGLYLWNTQVEDLSPLARLDNLSTLDLQFIQWEGTLSLAEVETMEMETRAMLDRFYIVSEYVPLPAEQLAMIAKLAEEVAKLGELAELVKLLQAPAKVRDLSPLAGLVNLTTLDLRGTPSQDLSPLDRLVKRGLQIIR